MTTINKGVALAMTVKNEEQLVRQNVLYHHYLGIDRVYIYLDRSTDGTRETISDLEFVDVITSIRRPTFQLSTHTAERLARKANEHHNARICLNMLDALERARNDKMGWLITLDADELLCSNLESQKPRSLEKVLSAISEDIDVVQFMPIEVLPCQVDVDCAFMDCRSFYDKDIHSGDGSCHDVLERRVRDPFEGAVVNIAGYLGHSEGKCAIRVRNSGRVFPRNVHYWSDCKGKDISTLAMRWLLHYNCHSATNFENKFRNLRDRPDTFLNGSVIEYSKRMWREFVNAPGVTSHDIRKYFEGNLVFGPSSIERLRNLKPSPLVVVESVNKIVAVFR